MFECGQGERKEFRMIENNEKKIKWSLLLFGFLMSHLNICLMIKNHTNTNIIIETLNNKKEV